jgi:hypothetical protein
MKKMAVTTLEARRKGEMKSSGEGLLFLRSLLTSNRTSRLPNSTITLLSVGGTESNLIIKLFGKLNKMSDEPVALKENPEV